MVCRHSSVHEWSLFRLQNQPCSINSQWEEQEFNMGNVFWMIYDVSGEIFAICMYKNPKRKGRFSLYAAVTSLFFPNWCETDFIKYKSCILWDCEKRKYIKWLVSPGVEEQLACEFMCGKWCRNWVFKKIFLHTHYSNIWVQLCKAFNVRLKMETLDVWTHKV